MLTSWNELPEWMKNEAVKEYYGILYNRRVRLSVKRIFDLTAAVVMFVLFSPVMLIISVAILADSRGGILYRQERVTRDGKVFQIHKFRTMVKDADKLGASVTTGDDVRITKIGAVLRRYRLDELPQLLDVINGDMTFVGTRPEAVKYVKRYTPEMNATLLLPAGITSEASIRFKDEANMLRDADDVDEVYVRDVLPVKMEYNLNSIRKFSLHGEFITMIRTVLAVMGMEF